MHLQSSAVLPGPGGTLSFLLSPNEQRPSHLLQPSRWACVPCTRVCHVPRPPRSRTCCFLPTFSLFRFWGLIADSNFLLFETTPTASLPHNEIIIVWHQWGIRAPSPSNVDALRALKRPRRCPLSGFTNSNLVFHF